MTHLKPQTERTVRALRSRGANGLTSLEALRWGGLGSRFAARVAEARAAGHDITSTTERTPDGAHVSRYVLHERPVQLRVFETPAEVHANHVRLGWRSGNCEICLDSPVTGSPAFPSRARDKAAEQGLPVGSAGG